MRIVISALSLCILCCTSMISSAKDPKLEALEQRIAGLDAGVRKAEAIRAVKRLQYCYGHYAELGLWHDFADLFADTGVGHYPSGELGKEAIRKLFLQDVGKGKLGLAEGQLYPHIMLQPVVNVAADGKTAKGRWRVLAMLGSYGGTAAWAGGIYENIYVLENGVWKINDLHYYSQYGGRYDQAGWNADKGTIPIHYDPALAGTPVPDNPGPAASSGSTLASLGERVRNLEERAQRLNDEDEVENLQHIYGYYVDRKMWDDVADLFADDATMESGQQGVYAGKTSIRRALNQSGPQGLRTGELNDHLQLQMIIDVAPDGRTARARGTELAMTGTYGIGGQWSEGIFENQYVKQNGIWRIQALHYYPRLITDYEKGWAKDAQPAPGPSREFPPDRPPTEVYETFPKFYIPPFHFLNPVTGVNAASRRVELKNDAAGRRVYSSDLESRIANAERLLKTAIAYDAAENLASAYGYYLDEFMWDQTADLFAADARRRFAAMGTETGREQIRQSLKTRYPGKKPTDFFLAHQLIQPVIHVAPDAQSAKMRVRLFQLGGGGGSGYWIAGIYETRTAIENGVWKFKAMDLDYIWSADYKGGWAHVDDNSASQKIVHAPYPKIIDLPFHYTNPVSGRKPPVYVP